MNFFSKLLVFDAITVDSFFALLLEDVILLIDLIVLILMIRNI